MLKGDTPRGGEAAIVSRPLRLASPPGTEARIRLLMLWCAALAVLALNLPFGAWRAHTRRLSLPWLLSIHLPIPAVIALRYAFGLGFQLATYLVMVPAFFLGQFLGSRLETRRLRRF